MEFSLIIPHRNTPKLLERLLRTVPDRDDLEVVVIDNSDEGFVPSEDLFHGRSNSRLLFSDKSLGAGGARNVGLENAKGEWLFFADADDYFNPCIGDFLEDLKGMSESVDMVITGISSAYSKTCLPAKRFLTLNDHIAKYIATNDKTELDWLKYLYPCPHSRFVRRRLVLNYKLRFDTTICQNDVKFSYMSGHYASILQVDRRAVYCSTVGDSQITGTGEIQFTSEKYLVRANVLADRYLFAHGAGSTALESNDFYSILAKLFVLDKKRFEVLWDNLITKGLTKRMLLCGIVCASTRLFFLRIKKLFG